MWQFKFKPPFCGLQWIWSFLFIHGLIADNISEEMFPSVLWSGKFVFTKGATFFKQPPDPFRSLKSSNDSQLLQKTMRGMWLHQTHYFLANSPPKPVYFGGFFFFCMQHSAVHLYIMSSPSPAPTAPLWDHSSSADPIQNVFMPAQWIKCCLTNKNNCASSCLLQNTASDFPCLSGK